MCDGRVFQRSTYINRLNTSTRNSSSTRLHKPKAIISPSTLATFNIRVLSVRAYTPLIRLTPLTILNAHQCALNARNCNDIISPTKKLITNTASGHASYAISPRKIINDIPDISIHSAGTRAVREKKKYESNRSLARLCVSQFSSYLPKRTWPLRTIKVWRSAQL